MVMIVHRVRVGVARSNHFVGSATHHVPIIVDTLALYTCRLYASSAARTGGRCRR